MSLSDTPVICLFFNRPHLLARTFERIRDAQPSRLFLVCDGPRSDKPEDAPNVEECRSLVENMIDWPCQVTRDYSDVNLGCRRRVSSGITAAFERTDRAIILEDDCLPDPSLFPYCAGLLERYADDERVMHISGTSFPTEHAPISESYYFSQYANIWGWATWRRAWRHYDVGISAWREPHAGAALRSQFFTKNEGDKWTYQFNQILEGLDTWDYQWQYALFHEHGLACAPRVNLVENIGFGEDATHTKTSSALHQQPSAAMNEIIHPVDMMPNRLADEFVHEVYLGGNQVPRFHNWRERLRRTLDLWHPRKLPRKRVDL